MHIWRVLGDDNAKLRGGGVIPGQWDYPHYAEGTKSSLLQLSGYPRIDFDHSSSSTCSRCAPKTKRTIRFRTASAKLA